MHRIDQATAVSTLPTPAAAGTPGYFTGGNPATGSPATVLDADWANNIQEELISILTAAGVTPSKTINNQVLSSLESIFSAPVVGTVRNLKCSVTSASSSATFTADEIVVESALGGLATKLASYSQTINLATTGVNGMDTGTAPTSGYVALYAIYNPSTSTASILATNATSAAAPSIYGGSHMPSGYVYSALISVWGTNSSSQFVVGIQNDRAIQITESTALATNTNQASYTSLSISGIVPLNAKTISGMIEAGNTNSGAASWMYLSPTGSPMGQVWTANPNAATNSATPVPYSGLVIQTPQTIYYKTSYSGGSIYQNGFTIREYTI